MGLFKFIASVGSGFILSPQTTRERSRKYQREANDLLAEQLYAMQNLAQPQTPSDTRPRGKCPECLEMMLVGASTCPHCHTTGITWSTETRQEPKAIDAIDACDECGGKVILEGSRLYCLQCEKPFRKYEYPHLFPKQSQQALETKETRSNNTKETKKAQSNNTKETGSVAKVFTFTIKWISILSLLAGAFWVTTNFHPIMAGAATVLTLLVAGGNHPVGLRGWVAWCLGAVLNGLWFVFTLLYQSSSSFFGDSPPWTRFLNFPSLVVVESIILIVVSAVLPKNPAA
jgi:hypothetical protein